MEKYEKVSIIAVILLAILLWLLSSVRVYPLSDIASNIPFFIITAMFGVFLWGWLKRIENALGKKATTASEEHAKYKLDQNFAYLAVHYLRTRGLPDTPKSARLIYITNDKSRKASRLHEIPEWLAPTINEHKIMWCPYDDERTLKKFVRSKYSVDDTEPIIGDLGLRFSQGILVTDELHLKLLKGLEGHNLEDLQIINLTRRYFFSLIRRTLLVKISKNQAWLAPSYIFELIDKEMITNETKGMRFWENCKKWCKRNGYTFIDQRYPESALLAEGS